MRQHEHGEGEAGKAGLPFDSALREPQGPEHSRRALLSGFRLPCLFRAALFSSSSVPLVPLKAERVRVSRFFSCFRDEVFFLLFALRHMLPVPNFE